MACVDHDEDQRQTFMKRWNVAKGFSDIESALADGRHWNVASVCTPTERHAADLRALLATPVRAVWCEKPITQSTSESRELVAAYERAGKHLAINHLRRWHPAMLHLKQEIQDGKWGAVRAAVGFYTKGVRHNGSHLLDLARYLVGPLTHVSGVVARDSDDPQTPGDPTLSGLLQTETGVPLHIVGVEARDYAMFELEIVTACGTIRIERSGRAIRLRRPTADPDTQGYMVLDDGELIDVGTGDVFLSAVDNIYQAVVNRARLACDGATALETERVCDALIEHARTGMEGTI